MALHFMTAVFSILNYDFLERIERITNSKQNVAAIEKC